ncbi:MAG: SDR family oxidoreductase [Oscillospiraceae bacterium]|nr:SDR family oxidoreductase [Oscillospiraceae bacterium]
MADRLNGKVAIITGAGSGIGAAIAKRFAAEGAKIIICGRRKENLEETAASCPEGSVLPYPSDVRKIEDAVSITEAALKFGGKIDILVNDAGIARRGGALDADIDEFMDVMATNVYGPLYLMRAVIPHMIKAGGGSIVSISSLAGVRRIPQAVSYCTSKEALIGLAQSVAMDYGKDKIRSNVICPGLTHTGFVDRMAENTSKEQGISFDEAVANMMRMSPIKRPVPTDEIAQACVFLASDESTTLTGAVLMVDSGTSIVDASIGAANPH